MKKMFFILVLLAFSSLVIFAQTEHRIIKMDKINEEDDEIYLEITSFKIGDSDIFFNEYFTADENWLKNIKIKVKNVSGKSVTFVAVVFGLIEGVNEELEPQMSWGDKLALYYGNRSENRKDEKKFVLKNGEEIELKYDYIDERTKKYFEKIGIGKFHKAKLINGTVKFKKDDFKDTDLRVPNNVRFFEEQRK